MVSASAKESTITFLATGQVVGEECMMDWSNADRLCNRRNWLHDTED
jgi:hypothetical protein